MTVRHLVAASDLAPDGTIADPSRVVHGAIRGGTVFAVGGPVDLDTHCNLDFPDHHLDACVVVAAITPGAPVVRNAAGAFAVAYGAPGHVASRGRVDLGARRVAWQRAVAAARVRRVADPLPLPRGGGIAYADNDGGVTMSGAVLLPSPAAAGEGSRTRITMVGVVSGLGWCFPLPPQRGRD